MLFRNIFLSLLTFAVSTLAAADAADASAVAPESKTQELDGPWSTNVENPRLYKRPECAKQGEGYTLNFEDISVLELIQFVSRISGTNFIFDKEDLEFSVTIVSEDASTIEDLMAALIQVLQTHQLSVVEQGNNILIFKNELLSKVSTVVTNSNIEDACDSAIVTRVFNLYHVDNDKIVSIVRPLLSQDAIVEVSSETQHLIVTDITANVNKIADLLEALDTPDPARMLDVAQYQVQGAYPAALVAYAQEILAPLAQQNVLQMVAQPSSNKIYVISTPFLVHRALEILESLDEADITAQLELHSSDLPANAMANNHFYMYKLKHQNGQEISDAIASIGTNLQSQGAANVDLVSTISSIQWLEVNNSLVISGTQESIDKVIGLIDDLDQTPKQVYIEVLIIDTTLENSLDFGVQWVALGEEQNKLAYASGLQGNSPPGSNITGTVGGAGANRVAGPPNAPQIPNPAVDIPLPRPANLAGFGDLASTASAFGLGIVGNILRHDGQSFLTLGALVSALEEEANTTVVLNPRIMTEDTQQANFFVGQNIPYQTTSTVVQQTGSVTQNVQYEDVGVQLRVTPTISPNNMVTLQIDQSVSDVVGTVGSTLTPTTNKTLATTRVHIPDGCFLVMSGHIRDEQASVHSGIPCLGSLPLIGPTFSRTLDQRGKRNLIMFLRPHVVSNIQEGLDLTNQEGYDYNWESSPCSIIECGPKTAPECETYPPPRCPPN